MNNIPLQYRISSWRQLPECLSNTSSGLRIHVTDFIENPFIKGFRIEVKHNLCGTLFACVLNARGDAVVPPCAKFPGSDAHSYELPKDVILKELEKFGFFITYNPRPNLSGPQLEYLMTLNKLKFDKIRKISTKSTSFGQDTYRTYLIAFRSGNHPKWLNDKYVSSENELSRAFMEGTATNLSEICETKEFNWDWLDYVARIDDIIADNSKDNIHDLAWNSSNGD